ncbi:MAG: hypothetical protein M1832_004311 [Thelocarpon impressellum]|nr:MAG: hypothetical protein M1832_004311 [Thelocarpon impressellum]
MGGPPLAEKAHGLSDLELAVLLSLVAEEHCIIETDEEAIDAAEAELRAISVRVFGLSAVVLDASANTTLDDLGNAILIEDGTRENKPPSRAPSRPEGSYLGGSDASGLVGLTDSHRIADVVIAKNLDLASHHAQIQALELLRTKRIFTRTEVHSAPKRFLFIALLVRDRPGPRLVSHLNDHIFLSHYHTPEDGFPNLEEAEEEEEEDAQGSRPLITSEDLATLTAASRSARVTIDVKRYMQNLAVFLRMHRAVAGGASSRASKHFDTLARCLAPLHGLGYVSPALVRLAARKVYPHRIGIVEARRERSMQWGSEIEAVEKLLEGLDAEDVIEDVIGSVEVPV